MSEKKINTENPETMVITEDPIITLEYRDFNHSDILDVYASELKNAKVGDAFDPQQNGGCGRGIHSETLTVVYKDATGVAAVYSCSGTTDSPDPKDWEDEDRLIWFRIH